MDVKKKSQVMILAIHDVAFFEVWPRSVFRLADTFVANSQNSPWTITFSLYPQGDRQQHTLPQK